MTNLSTISAKYWHILNLVLPQNLWKLWEISRILGGPDEIWESDESTLIQAGLNQKLSGRIVAARKNLNIEKEWQNLSDLGINALILNSPGYPDRLAQIHSAPPVIYVRG